eukprot:4742342-Lingulodinium_polyedra.AAC.1
MMLWIHQSILEPLRKELKDLSRNKPKSYAGLQAFNEADFKANMMEHGEYECMEVASKHKIGTFEHAGAPQSIGDIVRIAQQVWSDKESGSWVANGFTHAVTVRAVSKIDPSACTMEPVHRAAYLLAFMFAWAQATQNGESTAADFKTRARQVRTRFLYLPDTDEYERRKWTMQETAVELADNTNLTGYQRVLAVVGVRDMLAARSLPCTNVAVAAWFKKANMSTTQEPLTAKTIGIYTKIHGRVHGLGRATALLVQLNSLFGRKHVLAHVSVLDYACQKTAMPDASALAAKVLEYVVEGLAVLMLRGDLKQDATRDHVVQKVIPALLLIRRCTVYLVNKFRFKDEADKHYLENRAPSCVLQKVFGNYSTYHDSFPKGVFAKDNDIEKPTL